MIHFNGDKYLNVGFTRGFKIPDLPPEEDFRIFLLSTGFVLIDEDYGIAFWDGGNGFPLFQRDPKHRPQLKP